MRIAIPLVNCKLANHFGHCTSFVLFDVDGSRKEILRRQYVPAPPCQPGLLPELISKHGVNMVIAGGIGVRAVEGFARKSIQVIHGASCEKPEKVVMQYLEGSLRTDANPCDH